MKLIIFIAFTLLALCSAQTPFITNMLKAHNDARAAVGVPPLRWSAELQASAKEWANHLAETQVYQHSHLPGVGENIGLGTRGLFAGPAYVRKWVSEKKNFIEGCTWNKCSKTGNWRAVGHYSQVVWRETTEVGCGYTLGKQGQKWDAMVCHYSPPGNANGEKVY